MQYSSRTAIASHILMYIGAFGGRFKITSDVLAQSVNVNPVVVRTVLSKLKKGGLINVEPGVGGASLSRPADQISMLDIFRAMEPDEELFRIHDNPNPDCPIGRHVRPILYGHLMDVDLAMATTLRRTTLQDLLQELSQRL